MLNAPQLPNQGSIPRAFQSFFEGTFPDDVPIRWTDDGRRVRWAKFLMNQTPLVQLIPSPLTLSDFGSFPAIRCWFFSLKKAKKTESLVWDSFDSRLIPTITKGSMKGWSRVEFTSTFTSIMTAMVNPCLIHDQVLTLLPTENSLNELFVAMVQYMAFNLKTRFWPLAARRSNLIPNASKWMEEQLRQMPEQEIYDMFCRFFRSRSSPDGFFSTYALPQMLWEGKIFFSFL